ncbi:hypothetical protein JG687_00016985 [Phytophthora cactorum]|uniref:Uncharacterized protein n=1 Tax=Phytophthora cactorum TaxID=29920 RepID=A0A8T1TQY0_9STRA|nr:hypothetical protein JG687_00016985 [Phytophthora cactorum]
MDTTVAVIVDVVSASVAVAIAIAADKRSLASERENVSTFPTETLDRALKARYTSEHVTGDASLLLEAPPPTAGGNVIVETSLSHTQGEARRSEMI